MKDFHVGYQVHGAVMDANKFKVMHEGHLILQLMHTEQPNRTAISIGHKKSGLMMEAVIPDEMLDEMMRKLRR